jgi:hypothetical protein
LAETLRLNTTRTSLVLDNNDKGEGGGRAFAETLRLNSTLKELDLDNNDLGEGGGRALAEKLRLNTSLTLYLRFNPNLGEHAETEIQKLLAPLSQLHEACKGSRVRASEIVGA